MSDAYANQAFALGRSLGLQFHLEVEPATIEAWLIDHAAELAATGPTRPSCATRPDAMVPARSGLLGR